MKHSALLLISLLFLSLYSCRSVKDLTYLQDVADREIISEGQKNIPEYKVRPMDNLYVSIKTLDPEVNILFSPSGQTGNSMTGTSQMFGGEVSQYINGYQIDSTGTITLPILGRVEIEGLSLEQARVRIQSKALEYLQEPVVEVKLLSFRINISGEVRSPGVYYHYQGKLTILDALTMANGITDNATLESILVIRQNGKRTETYRLDLTKKGFYKSEAYYLYPYDMVIVNSGFNKKYDLNVQTYQLVLTTLSTIFGLNFLYNNFNF